MSPRILSLAEARRIALAAQGFSKPRPRGRVDLRHVRRTIQRLGLIQIDYVNVLTPAHYQVPFSRLGAYSKPLLDDLVYRKREFTEHWAHEASIVPVEIWPLLRYRMERHRVRPWGFEKFLDKYPDYVSWVLEQIRERGPLAAGDLPELDTIPRRMLDRWGWGMAVKKSVLEAHFGSGRLAAAGRLPNLARVYDLAERVVPRDHCQREVTPADAQRALLHRAAGAIGVGTVPDLADYYRMPVREARPRVLELVEARKLTEVRVEGWREEAYLYPAARQPARIEFAALLSPFDPLVWYRPRVKRLFGFDYRIEIFVPKEKRKWGYYVLPFLLNERLAARVDLKADRIQRRLRVLAAHREQDVRPSEVADALAAELREMATWLDLDSVSVGRPGNLARALARAVGSSVR